MAIFICSAFISFVSRKISKNIEKSRKIPKNPEESGGMLWIMKLIMSRIIAYHYLYRMALWSDVFVSRRIPKIPKIPKDPEKILKNIEESSKIALKILEKPEESLRIPQNPKTVAKNPERSQNIFKLLEKIVKKSWNISN